MFKELIMSWMLALGANPNEVAANAIEYVVLHDRLLSEGIEYTAAVLTVTAYEESGFRNVRGDNGHAYCFFQVRPLNETDRKNLMADPIYCTRRALNVIREGYRICPDAPLAPFVGGCRVPAAREASVRRLRLAEDLLRANHEWEAGE